MFAHQSDGIRTLKRQISESLVLLLEANGYHVLNGLTEAHVLLEAHGYTVEPPAEPTAVESDTDVPATQGAPR